MAKVLDFEFFKQSALEVAPQLLGKNLCVKLPRGSIAKYPILEAEAYEGFEDKASHAHKGKTARNEIMFNEGGYIYVYLCYGIHWMLNIVTYEKETPSAVLIRSVGPWNGPGKLTKNLFIDKRHNKLALGKKAGLWIEEGDSQKKWGAIQTAPRIGVNYAGPKWAKVPWRFYL